MVCLKDSLSDTNPLIQKQRNKTQTLIKKRPSRLSTKKKGKKEEKKRQTLKSKPYIHIRILSSRLWLPPLRCNSIATQIRIPCSRSASIRKKKFQKEAKKKRLCSSSAKGKTEKLSSSSAKTGNSEDNSKGRHVFFPLFLFSIQLPFLGFWKLE